MTNRQVEDAAVEFVTAYEAAAGRTARDTRHVPGSPADMVSTDDGTGEERLIEVKAYGKSARGDDLWLEEPQVEAGRTQRNFHLYVVDNVRSGDPLRMRLLDLSGDMLSERLAAAKKRTYYTVPFPVSVYDSLAGRAVTCAIVWRIMDAVAVLHERGYHRIRFLPTLSPSGMHLRVHVGRDAEVGDSLDQLRDVTKVARGSFGGDLRDEWSFAESTLVTRTSAETIADRILAVIPPVEATSDDPGYVAWFSGLLRRSRALGELPVASQGRDLVAGGDTGGAGTDMWFIGDVQHTGPPARLA
ncbi:protein NO VEIN domain-containing protein [Brachybacterium sp. GCM10030267]